MNKLLIALALAPAAALVAPSVPRASVAASKSTRRAYDESYCPYARLSTSQRVALRPRYEPPPLRPATQQKPPRAAHGSNGGSRARATQIALPRNGTYGPPALATTLPYPRHVERTHKPRSYAHTHPMSP